MSLRGKISMHCYSRLVEGVTVGVGGWVGGYGGGGRRGADE